tara:strand:+ start:19222 stop:19950 length:729 start_codon:yes stop_codon:yes gene_type:complete
MAKVYMTLQGKGGVGKSLVSSFVAQYFLEQGVQPRCVDTDPVNQTFGAYKAFNPTLLKLGDNADEIDQRAFDGLIEEIMEAPDDAVFVVDNGAATFLPLINYLAGSEAVSVLTEAGHSVVPISILTGGQSLRDTAEGLSKLAAMVPDVPLLVVLNEYFGPVQKDGVEVTDTKLFKSLGRRIQSVIVLPSVTASTYGRDLENVLSRHLTFAECAVAEDLSVMERHRLGIYWRKIRAALTEANL